MTRARPVALSIALALAGACAPASVQSQHEDVMEGSPGCEDCVASLVGCVSTSRGDAQFMECRDLFAACQAKAGLEPGSCQNPGGEAACAACQDRRLLCDATDPDAARCAGDQAECAKRLGAVATCGGPSAEGGSGGVGGACPDCGTGGDAGSGAAGEGTGGEAGSGGAGGAGPVCHQPCELGEKMAPECGACAAGVCAADAYCCSTAWDKYCVQGALAVPACGCTTSSCSHAECASGVALSSDCSNCATLVCAAQPACCQVEWGSACVVEASAIAECGCPGA